MLSSASHFLAVGLIIDRELVGLATAFALVAVLYWMMTSRDDLAVAEQRTRPNPRNEDELARAVFRVAIDADIDGYRDLFLAGSEAARVFGEGAQAYLDNRRTEVLEEALVTLGAMIPEGSHYGGSTWAPDTNLVITIVPPQGQEVFQLAIGKVADVGGVYRIQIPPRF